MVFNDKKPIAGAESTIFVVSPPNSASPPLFFLGRGADRIGQIIVFTLIKNIKGATGIFGILLAYKQYPVATILRPFSPAGGYF